MWQILGYLIVLFYPTWTTSNGITTPDETNHGHTNCAQADIFYMWIKKEAGLDFNALNRSLVEISLMQLSDVIILLYTKGNWIRKIAYLG